ncbi:recombinase family protein [Streptomyces natalensis]|uniref:recombinase family protein n=1 Tax=Streptomyces natalensis TaxID=68242 RepID=UPI0026C908B6
MVLRPEFRQLLADPANGVIDGVIFYDLDRLVRQPRDLEDLIAWDRPGSHRVRLGSQG